MYDHIGLRVRDIELSVRFYEAALKSLGHVVNSRDANGAGSDRITPLTRRIWFTKRT